MQALPLKINFTKFEKKVNLVLLLVFFSFILVIFLQRYYPYPGLTILKTALEASLVGALADSYAVFGLFHKLGPHTNLLLRKREELTEKVVDFVGSFLFNEEFIRRELEKIDIDPWLRAINPDRVSVLFENVLTTSLNAYMENVLLTFKESFPLYFPGLDTLIDKMREKLKLIMKSYLSEKLPLLLSTFLDRAYHDEELKEDIRRAFIEYLKGFLRENHAEIKELVRRRLEEISDKDYVMLIKSASWDELQWIRFNGTLLGFCLGFLIGLIEILV